MSLEGQGNETEGEVPQGQASSAGVAPSQTPQSASEGQAQNAQPWKVKVGDTEYDETSWRQRGPEDFRKFHGEYTRTRQEFSKLRDEAAAGRELLEMVKGDPQLLAEVRGRMQRGQSQEQAVKQAVQNDPRVDQLYGEVETMKQEKATSAFRTAHPDLSSEDVEFVAKWVTDRSDKLRNSGWSYDEILDQAYNALFREQGGRKAAEALVKGQQMKEQEIQKGRKGQLLGAPSPTAQTQTKSKKSSIHMNPAEREAHAMDRFMANKRKG